jgi:hypothetical protein
MRQVVVLFVIGALSQASAQAPPPVPTQPLPQFRNGKTEQTVTVEGCLYDKVLKPDLSATGSLNTRLIFETLNAKELLLEGAKELMQSLQKEHYGHQDEISGLVLVPGDRDVGVGSTPIGPRTRITGGSSGPGRDAVGTSEPSRTPEWQKRLVIRVASLRHLADKCSFPG